MAVRILRLMEYMYPDQEVAELDMSRWQVPANGTKNVTSDSNSGIRSCIISDPFAAAERYSSEELDKINDILLEGGFEFPLGSHGVANLVNQLKQRGT